MNAPWTMAPLGHLLTGSEDWIEIKPADTYRLVTVRLWGRGVAEREAVTGAQIAAEWRLRIHPGQFILSRIDARNGAFGVVPPDLEGAVVTSDFPTYDVDQTRVLPGFLAWMSKTERFIDICKNASAGTTNRIRLDEGRFLAAHIPLPPIDEQRRIVARIEELATKVGEIRTLQREMATDARDLLLSVYARIVEGAEWLSMSVVAPLVRRPVGVGLDQECYEVGIRSYGKGTFHKPPVRGASLGTKRVFRIEGGDLIFNIVFAWEGAIAVAGPDDHGRIGSHRFLTCVPNRDLITPTLLKFHFLTETGLGQLGQASPGGAGRNRTLGLDALRRIAVPVPALEKQLWFEGIHKQMEAVNGIHDSAAARLDALLPSILDKAFKGEL